MKPAHIVSITTPEGVQLDGIWYGPKKAQKIFIVIHGLGSSVFSNNGLFAPLADDKTAVLMFNNRGHDKVTRIRKRDLRRKKGYRSIVAGASHEIFTDCRDDIAGAINVALSHGVQEVILIGHSTGCQKAVYYLSHSPRVPIKKLILLSPLSDSAGIRTMLLPDDLKRLQNHARQLVDSGKPHTLLPQSDWPPLDDAQRFLSLSSPDSPEELFPYAYQHIKPTRLISINKPILIILGGNDEYRDRPIKNIAKWFETTLPHQRTVVIPHADHSFSQHYRQLQKLILNV